MCWMASGTGSRGERQTSWPPSWCLKVHLQPCLVLCSRLMHPHALAIPSQAVCGVLHEVVGESGLRMAVTLHMCPVVSYEVHVDMGS